MFCKWNEFDNLIFKRNLFVSSRYTYNSDTTDKKYDMLYDGNILKALSHLKHMKISSHTNCFVNVEEMGVKVQFKFFQK